MTVEQKWTMATPTADELNKLKVADLKEKLKEAGLPVIGQSEIGSRGGGTVLLN